MSILLHVATNTQMKAGDVLQTFRGEFVKLESWEDPYHDGSTGRIYVRHANDGFCSSFFPSVCGCKIVGDDNAAT